jgi:hypothetical protein
MPELDKWFPRDESTTESALEPKRRKTEFPRAAEYLRDLCDTFAEETGWKLDHRTRHCIAAGALDFYNAIGNRPDLLKQALDTMKRKQLTFSSPRSCITIARGIEADEPKSYTEGEYADFIEH